MEVERYKEELETEKKEEYKKIVRLERNKRKQVHWEMLKWIVSFSEENKEKWDKIRSERRKDKRAEAKNKEWKMINFNDWKS